jgi:hypothetical protein
MTLAQASARARALWGAYAFAQQWGRRFFVGSGLGDGRCGESETSFEAAFEDARRRALETSREGVRHP